MSVLFKGVLQFQFTHPGKGATSLHRTIRQCTGVSIHAPWEGCDGTEARAINQAGCFNSRTLGRVRQATASDDYYFAWFQFTHPGKGATCSQLT